MKDEQERGRITAIRNRRMKAVQFALSMTEIIRQARREMGNPTFRDFADWLNARNIKTVTGKTWRSQTVSNLLSVDDLIIRNAEDEHRRSIAIEAAIYRRSVATGQDRAKAKSVMNDAIAVADQSLVEAKAEAARIRILLNTLL